MAYRGLGEDEALCSVYGDCGPIIPDLVLKVVGGGANCNGGICEMPAGVNDASAAEIALANARGDAVQNYIASQAGAATSGISAWLKNNSGAVYAGAGILVLMAMFGGSSGKRR